MRFPDFPGHFPGDPIVPGAALLVEVERRAGRRVARLERLRFLAVVRPGEDVTFDVTIEGDRARFRARRADEEVLRGSAILAPPAERTPGPLRSVPTLSRPVWGGSTLADEMGKDPDPAARIGESWEVWRENRRPDGARLGDAVPLLVKLLDVRETLSVQVHPDDDAARRLLGAPHGKHEAWVVLRAEPGARVAYGLNRRMGRDELRDRAVSGAIEADLAWREVRPGDVIDVPPGTIHAIGGGVLFYEVQQPCDLTFRLYDWGRGRPLHLEQALEVAVREPVVSRASPRRVGDADRLIDTEHFRVERLVLPATRRCEAAEAVTVVGGRMRVAGEEVAFGASIVLPPGEWALEGEGTVLVAGDCAGASGAGAREEE